MSGLAFKGFCTNNARPNAGIKPIQTLIISFNLATVIYMLSFKCMGLFTLILHNLAELHVAYT